jgi:histidinol-phosphate aminotransferase
MSPENFVTGNGGCDVLTLLATAFLNPGDECVVCRPTFPVYDITARRIGASVTHVNLNPEHFTYDVEDILAAVTERTRLVYVCSPNNPTGTILTAAQMDTLVNNLPSHTLLVTDEVYHHFVTADNYPDSLRYVQAGKNVLILHSFSKAFGLAGLRLGYAIAPAEIAQYLSRAREPFHLSSVAFAGGIAALRDRVHLEKAVDLVVSGRNWLKANLATLEVQVWPSQGNFILFKPPFAAAEVSEQLLRRGVIARPMSQFYLPTHLRVTVGLPEENERFIAALRDTLAELELEGAPKESKAEKSSEEFKF